MTEAGIRGDLTREVLKRGGPVFRGTTQEVQVQLVSW